MQKVLQKYKQHLQRKATLFLHIFDNQYFINIERLNMQHFATDTFVRKFSCKIYIIY